MTSKPQTAKPSRSLAKGLIAGFLGGLAGAAAKAAAEKLYPPRTTSRHAPSALLTESASINALTPHQQGAAPDSIHWTFGPLMGAAYGALAEFAPMVTDRHGVTFGVALCSLTHEGTLPGRGLESLAATGPLQEKSSEMVSHAAYGVVTETVRRTIRRIL